MPDLYTLFAKIQSLPKRRIAEVEDFVDFLTLRRAAKATKPALEFEKMVDHPGEGRATEVRRARIRLNSVVWSGL